MAKKEKSIVLKPGSVFPEGEVIACWNIGVHEMYVIYKPKEKK